MVLHWVRFCNIARTCELVHCLDYFIVRGLKCEIVYNRTMAGLSWQLFGTYISTSVPKQHVLLPAIIHLQMTSVTMMSTLQKRVFGGGDWYVDLAVGRF